MLLRKNEKQKNRKQEKKKKGEIQTSSRATITDPWIQSRSHHKRDGTLSSLSTSHPASKKLSWSIRTTFQPKMKRSTNNKKRVQIKSDEGGSVWGEWDEDRGRKMEDWEGIIKKGKPPTDYLKFGDAMWRQRIEIQFGKRSKLTLSNLESASYVDSRRWWVDCRLGIRSRLD